MEWQEGLNFVMGEMSCTTELVTFQIVFCCTGSHTHG